MKTISLLLLLLISLPLFAQWDTKDAEQFQKELDEWYANAETTALTDAELKNFDGLNYFLINDDFIVEATFTKAKKQKTKNHGTSSGKKRAMIDYGTLTFQLQGEEHRLVVLQNTKVNDPEYADYLTIAFTDLTSGEESYGGGRYLGVREHELEDGKVTLNFNLAYHPSCAYNPNYSCLVPPRKNRLPIRIEAGVKMGFKTKND